MEKKYSNCQQHCFIAAVHPLWRDPACPVLSFTHWVHLLQKMWKPSNCGLLRGGGSTDCSELNLGVFGFVVLIPFLDSGFIGNWNRTKKVLVHCCHRLSSVEGIGERLCGSFWFLKERWSHGRCVTMDIQKGSPRVCRVGSWHPINPVFESAHVSKSTCLFHCGEKNKIATRKRWQIFPACWSCGFITINRTLNWLFESGYKNW